MLDQSSTYRSLILSPGESLSLNSKLSDSLLALIFPRECSICGGPAEAHDDGPVCAGCWQLSEKWMSPPIGCLRCGWPALLKDAQPEPKENCLHCGGLELSRLRALGAYHGALKAVALALKREPHLARRVVRLVENMFRDGVEFPHGQCVVPVPLHPVRARERGFNQAEFIARLVARASGLPCERGALIRSGQTPKHRAGMDARERASSLKGAFSLRRPGAIRGCHVLLVDDVFTTGATLNECARSLKSAGATVVYGFTLARVVD